MVLVIRKPDNTKKIFTPPYDKKLFSKCEITIIKIANPLKASISLYFSKKFFISKF